MTRKEEREYSFDVMRVLAAVSVIIIHVCAMRWRSLDVHSSEWLQIHVYDMLAKFSVPLFFVISGRFLLDPEREENAVSLRKKIIRIAIAFLFWTVVYTILTILRVLFQGDPLKANLNWIIVEFFSGEYHMWYLYAIAGLYLITPFLRLIAKDRKLTEYYLVLAFVFQFLAGVLERVPGVRAIVNAVSEEMVFHYALGFSGYYVLGYYLYRYPPTRRMRRVLYIAGVVGAIVSCALPYYDSIRAGAAEESSAGYLTLNVLLTTAAIYAAILAGFSGNEQKQNRLITRISSLSFGIYLVHPVFLWIFEWLHFYPTFIYPVLGVPLMTLIVLVMSAFAAKLIRKIPVIGRMVS